MAVWIAMTSTGFSFFKAIFNFFTTPQKTVTALKVLNVKVENPNVDLRKKMKTMQKNFSPQFRVTVQKCGRKTFYVQFTCYINGKRFASAQDWHDSVLSTLESSNG